PPHFPPATPAVETHTAPKTDRRDRPAPPLPATPLGARVRNPQRLARAYASIIGLVVVLAAIVWGGWALFRSGPDYQQQFASANTYFEQKDFAKAIEVLQQIPSSSPLYRQARELLTKARNAAAQRNIDTVIAEATALHKQKEDDKSLAAIQKVLDLDPSNQAAKSIRDEIEVSKYQNKTQAEQDSYVKESLDNAQELFNAGKFQEAKTKLDEVILVRPDDRTAANLNRRIASQLEAQNKMNSERSLWEQARAAAVSARAAELDQPRFAAAQRAEELALRQQNAKQFDQAARRFAEAAGLYRDAERTARSELQARAEREKD